MDWQNWRDIYEENEEEHLEEEEEDKPLSRSAITLIYCLAVVLITVAGFLAAWLPTER